MRPHRLALYSHAVVSGFGHSSISHLRRRSALICLCLPQGIHLMLQPDSGNFKNSKEDICGVVDRSLVDESIRRSAGEARKSKYLVLRVETNIR